jgi:hypothetical protein
MIGWLRNNNGRNINYAHQRVKLALPELSVQQFLSVFIIPDFYFHLNNTRQDANPPCRVTEQRTKNACPQWEMWEASGTAGTAAANGEEEGQGNESSRSSEEANQFA